MSSKLTYTHQAFFICSFFVAAFPIMPMRWSVIFIILWGVSAAVNLVVNGKKDWNKNFWLFVLFSALIIYYALSFLFYDMPEGSGHYIERRLSLLIFPLGFYLVDPGFQKKQRNWLLLTFELSSFLLTALIVLKGLPLILKNHQVLTMGTSFNYAFRSFSEKLVGIHPTYLSVFLLFAVFLKLHRLVDQDMKKPWWDISWNAFQMALMMLCCLMLSARGPLIAFGVAIIFYFFRINWKRTIIGLAATLPLVVILFLNVPTIGGRFNELIKATKSEQVAEHNSSTIRKEIFKCTSGLLKEHWFWGIGIGNVQPALNKCYEKNGQEKLREMEFNTHNQYAQIWISIGLPGIIIFILMLGIPFYLSVKKNELPYQVFLIMMAICFFTENSLARQHGVVFYAFFNALFAFHLISPIKR